MKKLKILVGRHYDFNSSHYTSFLVDSIRPELDKYYNTSICWFCYLPNPIKRKTGEKEEIVNIQDYSDADELLKEIKPDLIIENEFPALIDLALSIASKTNHIPMITKILADREQISLKQLVFSFIPMFFHSSIPSDKGEQKQFLKRGRFFLYKYKFFLKTVINSKLKLNEKLEYIAITVRWHLKNRIPFMNPRTQTDLLFLQNESLEKELIQSGYIPEKIVVTGNPIFDKILQKSKDQKREHSDKIRILFAPIQLYEGGVWTKFQQENTIKKILRWYVENKEEFVLKVKLHPSSQIYEYYKELIHNIDPTIEIFQNGSIEEHVISSDVVITYGGMYSSLVSALIAKKPIIICKFNNYEHPEGTDENIVTVCNDPKKLKQSIELAIKNQQIKTKNIEKYLEKRYYKLDGLASKRLVEAIRNIIT